MRRCSINRALLLSLVAGGMLGCSQGESFSSDSTKDKSAAMFTTLAQGESFVPVEGGRIWIKTSGVGSGIPLIMIHGGPGFSSNYFKPLEALGDERVVVRYDQLGSGKADRMRGTTLYTIEHFVKELEALRVRLGYDRVNLLGHSWGTIVALEYYHAHPEHVASLTLASAFIDLPAWTANARRFVATLSDSSQRAIAKHEADGKFDAPDYQAAVQEYYARYLVRRPVVADMDSTLKSMNDSIYNYMQGPSEFTITGTLKDYNATDYLKDVHVPLLYTVGEFDEADPATVKRFASMTPGARVVVIPNSAHITMWDNGPAMIDAVRSFLRSVDSTTRR